MWYVEIIKLTSRHWIEIFFLFRTPREGRVLNSIKYKMVATFLGLALLPLKWSPISTRWSTFWYNSHPLSLMKGTEKTGRVARRMTSFEESFSSRHFWAELVTYQTEMHCSHYQRHRAIIYFGFSAAGLCWTSTVNPSTIKSRARHDIPGLRVQIFDLNRLTSLPSWRQKWPTSNRVYEPIKLVSWIFPPHLFGAMESAEVQSSETSAGDWVPSTWDPYQPVPCCLSPIEPRELKPQVCTPQLSKGSLCKHHVEMDIGTRMGTSPIQGWWNKLMVFARRPLR